MLKIIPFVVEKDANKGVSLILDYGDIPKFLSCISNFFSPVN